MEMDELTAWRAVRFLIWAAAALWLLPRATNHIRAIVLLYLASTFMLFYYGSATPTVVAMAIISELLLIKVLVDIAENKLIYKGRSIDKQVEVAKYHLKKLRSNGN